MMLRCKAFKMQSAKMFQVFYLIGGYTNMVCRSLVGKFNEADANKQMLELNKMGYPAQKIEDKGKPIMGYFISSFECQDEAEMKKHYQSAHAIGFAPINQQYGF